MDTLNFSELTPDQYKEQTQLFWSSSPCGSNYTDKNFMTREFYEEVERYRYSSHPWIQDNINSFDIKNKKILEIGYGMGTDHLAMARMGGIMHGIDLTPNNRVLTKKRLEIYGYNSELTIGDAENLPYRDNSFDFVYSFGVVHHSPDTGRIISEIHRVLKPGGKCWVTVYNRKSIFFLWSVYMVDWIMRGAKKRETLKQRISRIEYPNNNPNLVIRLYSRPEFMNLFGSFSKIKSYIDHLYKDDIAYFGKYMPNAILKLLGKKYGWYVIVEAVK